MKKNINNKNNSQKNFFFKNSNINIKDYIPDTIKPNDIREGKLLNFPEVSEIKYPHELYPNCLYEKWPSDEEVKSFDFNLNSSDIFNDPNNNLLVLPYSLRKETFNTIAWMRPNEYMKQKNLLKKIKETFQNKNSYVIKDKFSMAYSNILNFKNKKYNDNEISNNNIKNQVNKNANNIKEIIYEEVKNEKINNGLNSIDNFKLNIKKRNSIDISDIIGDYKDYSEDFINGKLSNKEKSIFEENENKNFDFFIVKSEIEEIKEEKIVKEEKIFDKKNFKHKITEKDIEKKLKGKLLPNNLSLKNYLSDFCKWISSIFQLIIDNKLNKEKEESHFIRRIYPQNENGIPIYNPSGKYWVKLFHIGEERKIEIDDKIPVNKFTYEPFFPQCDSPYELWPLILTKALIKLYSYKYRSEYYENNEVGDISLLYSLTNYIGISLPKDNFYFFLKLNQSIGEKNSDKDSDKYNKSKNLKLTLLKKNSINFDYDLLIGFFKSNDKILTNKMENNSSTPELFPLSPIIKSNDLIKYKEKIFKTKNRNSIINGNNNTINFVNTKEIKNKRNFSSSRLFPSFTYELSNKFNIYNRFKIEKRNKLFINRQKSEIYKENKMLDNGIICNMGYSILELFLSHNFNMKRTKPILFDDLKLDIKSKYKQMSPEEKLKYIEDLKELRVKQKKEKEIRINEYLDIGKELMYIRIFNGSNFNKDLKIKSYVTCNEIKVAKFCIENDIPFPPEKYFEKSFIPKSYKDEDTGKINFWTKKFFYKLLQKYFKEQIIKKENNTNDFKSTKNSDESNLNQKANNLYEEYKQHCFDLEEKFDKELSEYTPGTWMTHNIFINSFNKFILLKNSFNFKNKLNINNWYSNKSDVFEAKDSSYIIHLIKDNNEIFHTKNKLNPFVENELYIIFESNSEKIFKSISSGLKYESNHFTKNSNKFNDIEFSIIISIYQKENDNNAIKIKEFTLKGFNMNININLSDLDNTKIDYSVNEYFILIQGDKCPFGYYLQFFSNIFIIENYCYKKFMINFNNFKEKKFDLYHPSLRQYNYYLMAHLIIEYNEEEKQKNEIIYKDKFVTINNDIFNYDDNYIKNNIEIILINNITNKKINLYYRKPIKINFNKCPKYIIEISIKSPQDIPEKKFEYSILYNNLNLNFNLCPNLQPFYIREKYILNKNLNIFNELIFSSDNVTATFDISLEYRPSKVDKIEGNIDLDLNEENLPEIQIFNSEIPLNLSLNYGEKNILKKYFINNTIIRNLELKGKLANTKENKNKEKSKEKPKGKENKIENLKIETYILKCSLDPSDCPDYLKNFSLYKNDFYWKITVFCTDPICFVKNTIKEDIQNAIKEEWEINQPGRAQKARISRKKYFLNIKSKSGELLSPEEEEILNSKIYMNHEKDLIESNSNMIITNIPPKINKNYENIDKRKNNKIEMEKNNKNIDEHYNFLFKEKLNEFDLMKRKPKIKKYFSFVMKNFYSYSQEKRIIIKNTRRNNVLKLNFNSLDNNINNNIQSLPNIHCKTPDTILKEMKQIEIDYDNYKHLKSLEIHKTLNDKLLYDEEKKILLKKFINKRFKLKKLKENNNLRLLNIIKLNNNQIDNNYEIEKLNKNIEKYLKETKSNKEDLINEELFLNWYEKYKKIINQNKDIIEKDNKLKRIMETIKNNLSYLLQMKLKDIKNSNKKDNYLNKFIDIVNEKFLNFKN